MHLEIRSINLSFSNIVFQISIYRYQVKSSQLICHIPFFLNPINLPYFLSIVLFGRSLPYGIDNYSQNNNVFDAIFFQFLRHPFLLFK